MNVTHTYSLRTGDEINFEKSPKPSEVLEYAMWSSEENPFDPMEKSIHQHFSDLFVADERKHFKMVKKFSVIRQATCDDSCFSKREKSIHHRL